MGAFPTGFLYLMLGIIVGAFMLTLLSFGWRQYKLQQLRNPHKDYFSHRKRG